MLAAYSMMVGISSLFALFIGMFIIYNSFAIAVTQRRSEIGILRALGATRRQIRWLFLGESAVTGLIGSLGGLVFGVLIARAIAATIGALISDVYGVAQHADELSTSPGLLVLALAIGIVTSVIAAAIPAHSAARVDPVQALQKCTSHSAGEEPAARDSASLGACRVVCLSIGFSRLLSPTTRSRPCLAARQPAASLGSPDAAPVSQGARPVEGALAADSLIQSPRRTSASVAALMLSLALVIAFSGMARASYVSIIDWMETALNPELFIMPSQSIVVRTMRFPAAMGPEVAAIPGVKRVQSVRDARIMFRNTPVMIVSIEVDSMAETAQLPPVAGDAAEMYRRAAAGEGLIVADNLAQLQHLKLGDRLEVPAPNGVIRLPIVGVILDYSDQQGTIFMDRRLFTKYWNDDSVNVFRVYLNPGATVPDVRRRILEQYAGQRQVFVLTNRELKSYILKVTDQWFGLTSVQIAVAVLVAILGIVNTLTVSITVRRRELGVLQAVGGLRGRFGARSGRGAEHRHAGLRSSACAVNLYYVLQIVHTDIAGMRLIAVPDRHRARWCRPPAARLAAIPQPRRRCTRPVEARMNKGGRGGRAGGLEGGRAGKARGAGGWPGGRWVVPACGARCPRGRQRGRSSTRRRAHRRQVAALTKGC